jgi:Na+/H+ antiporter NhaD/arsenite permease-like protein
LGSLFTVTGGIYLKGDISAKPWVNTLFLGIGAILASFMGTTGAAMLLLRPVIKTIQDRKYKTHTILFFIAVVANCGGLLTPLGDPPLFLLYLRGVEFTWFLKLIPAWALANGLLLTVYFIWDSYLYKKEDIKNVSKEKGIKIVGGLNFLWLAGIIVSVAFVTPKVFNSHNEELFTYLQSGAILLMAVLSLLFTVKSIRESNKFSWGPITEVAFLFLGIFITMVPTLLYLSQNASSLGLNQPWHFYYSAGALSSFLDNAPTAVTFYGVAQGVQAQGGFAYLANGTFIAGIPEIMIKAISLGAVLFGSMTYIGNGPNFMVKAVAEENNISMPSFFGYMIKFSLIVLLPIYIIVHLVCL